MGAGFGALNAAVNRDKIWYGALSGFVIGSIGGMSSIFAPYTAGVAAATASLIGDRVNGRDRNFKSASIAGATAFVFAGIGSEAIQWASKIATGAVYMGIVYITGSTIFGVYNFVTDVILSLIGQ
ncbi:hypothetical protein EOM82_09465 [bacterium]|nr:hypothetical protein [bacterium]